METLNAYRACVTLEMAVSVPASHPFPDMHHGWGNISRVHSLMVPVYKRQRTRRTPLARVNGLGTTRHLLSEGHASRCTCTAPICHRLRTHVAPHRSCAAHICPHPWKVAVAARWGTCDSNSTYPLTPRKITKTTFISNSWSQPSTL